MLVIGASVILTWPLVLLIRHFLDLGNQYSAFAYLQTSVRNSLSRPSSEYPSAAVVEADDKIVVMAKVESEDTNWVARELPSSVVTSPLYVRAAFPFADTPPLLFSWQRAIYTVNPSTFSSSDETLTTPMNKGREAMAYLTYIIDNYASLPSVMAFVHPHRSGFLSAWHTDAPLHSNVAALNSLQTSFVQQNGYANLRCNWNPGCIEKHRKNRFVTPEVWREVFNGTSTDKGAGQDAPRQVGAACCAQFAVSRSRVLERPLSDFVHFRQWIIDTDKTDYTSGRVFEYLWHVIFGMEAL